MSALSTRLIKFVSDKQRCIDVLKSQSSETPVKTSNLFLRVRSIASFEI